MNYDNPECALLISLIPTEKLLCLSNKINAELSNRTSNAEPNEISIQKKNRTINIYGKNIGAISSNIIHIFEKYGPCCTKKITPHEIHIKYDDTRDADDAYSNKKELVVQIKNLMEKPCLPDNHDIRDTIDINIRKKEFLLGIKNLMEKNPYLPGSY